MDGDVSYFRRIVTTESFQPVGSLQHAYECCSSECAQEKALGLQYMGWHALVQAVCLYDCGGPKDRGKVEYAIARLKESIDAGQFVLLSALVIYVVDRTSDPSFSDTWYMLGRAYQWRDAHRKARRAFQQAVFRERGAAVYWLSIGILNLSINQWIDSLDAFTHAIILSPLTAIAWFNIGVLVGSPKFCQTSSH